MNSSCIILYKIRDWNDRNHRRVLTHNELFLTSPSLLNDNLDCRNSFDFSLLDTEDKVARYVKKVSLENPRNKEQKEDEYNKLLQELAKKLSTPEGRQKHQKDHNAMFFKMMDNQYGVLSLTTKWNVETLWNRYGAEQKGFAVGFNEEKIKSWVIEGCTLFGKGGMVSYHKDLPRVDPLNSNISEVIFSMTHTKTSYWAEEKEYRFTTHFGALFGDKFVPSLDNRIVSIPEEFMTEVVLGQECSMKHQTEIVSIARNRGLPVFRIKNSKTGELNRHRIA